MHTFVNRFARLMALMGGLVLTLLIALTCASVIGRTLDTLGHTEFLQNNIPFLANFLAWFGPVNGDFELVEAGVAFAIMACVPWCQLQRGHAVVEMVTNLMPTIASRFLAFLWEVLFAAVLFVIAWRLYVGTTDKMRYGETTFMLQFPIWWGYAACTVAAVFAFLTALYSVWLHFRDINASGSTDAGSISS